MVNKYKTAVLFGALHGINDFIAGFILASLTVTSHNIKLNTLAFLVYSIIAFGGQLPAGIIVDKSKKIKLFSILSIAFMIVAVSLFYVNIFFAIFFSALASAFIHVCGGAACFLTDNKSSTLAGIFTSPGVVGLIIGGIIGTTDFSCFYVLILILFVLLLIIISTKMPTYQILENQENKPLLDTHDFFMLVLLLAIAFRSLLWNIMHMICFNNTTWLYAIACSAFIGKILGGFISDRIDWKKFVFITVFSSAILLNLGKNSLPIFCIGVALLQSAVPITLLLMQQYLQKSPAFGAGLALGISIIFAGLPTYINQFRTIQGNQFFLILISIVFIVTNYAVIKMKKTSI